MVTDQHLLSRYVFLSLNDVVCGTVSCGQHGNMLPVRRGRDSMKIINLIENTEGTAGCAFAHGLSFYVETEHHKLLMDLGPSEETIRNADHLGIDLKKVDTVILSHGHYDHSGGILPFWQRNQSAVIYMQRTAILAYFSVDDSNPDDIVYKYIGNDPIVHRIPNVTYVDGDHTIDEELKLFVMEGTSHKLPFTSGRLRIQNEDRFEQDRFRHEHFLVVSENGKTALLSGCAHNGITNIMKEYVRKFGAEPDIVVSGFHLMKKTDYTDAELWEIRRMAEELMAYDTKYYTCHCTGLTAYEVMKEMMGDQLKYIHSGEAVRMNDTRGRN